MELSDVSFREVFLVLEQMMIMLISFDSPAAIPAPPNASNRIGVSKVSFGVADIDNAARHIVAHGGKVLEHSRTEGPQAIMMTAMDPDGTRFGLVQRTG